MRSALLLLAFISLACSASACSFARSGLPPPNDPIHRSALGRALGGSLPAGGSGSSYSSPSTYPVLPGPVSTANNAFVQNDLQGPIPATSGNGKTLLENLEDFARDGNYTDGLCYWAFQGLPPPRGTSPPYWDVDSGRNDQDIEWVQAYGEVAVARLHSRITEDGGPVVGAMCAMGARIAKRRCDNGKSRKSKCVPAVTNATIQWPMAVSLWKVGGGSVGRHQSLLAANTDWRANATTGHLPNVEWVTHLEGTSSGKPWAGDMPKPGEISPPAMPTGTDPGWPASQGAYWGCPKIAKVVQCSDIPAKFRYHKENYYCDHVADGSSVSSVDEAYAAWKGLQGVWPPTKQCKDDQDALDKVLTQLHLSPLVGQPCSVVFPQLQKILPNFDCDNSDTTPTIRNLCCSQCGGHPIPDVPAPPPAPTPPAKPQVACAVCKHQYDPDRDGGGRPFKDLPADWKCPICGAPKSAYRQMADGTWVHDEEEGGRDEQ